MTSFLSTKDDGIMEASREVFTCLRGDDLIPSADDVEGGCRDTIDALERCASGWIPWHKPPDQNPEFELILGQTLGLATKKGTYEGSALAEA